MKTPKPRSPNAKSLNMIRDTTLWEKQLKKGKGFPGTVELLRGLYIKKKHCITTFIVLEFVFATFRPKIPSSGKSHQSNCLQCVKPETFAVRDGNTDARTATPGVAGTSPFAISSFGPTEQSRRHAHLPSCHHVSYSLPTCVLSTAYFHVLVFNNTSFTLYTHVADASPQAPKKLGPREVVCTNVSKNS